jgi:tripartite-type tricarboxylate transporter receptor subunit TctC
MSQTRRRFVHWAVSAFAAIIPVLVVSSTAKPQTRTIKLVVPFPPGGGADTLARLLTDQIGRTQRLTVLVENRPGAGTAIATEAVSRAAPDGNTLLLVANSFVINPSLKALSYDPHTSFEPICLLTRSPNAIIVNGASAYHSLSELLAAARARPGQLTMAFQGPATSQHIGFEKLKRATGIEMIQVPFTGSAAAVNALLGGHVDSLFVNYPSAMEQVRAGKLRAIAVASKARVGSLSDVLTISEAGYPGYKEEDVWFGLVAPAGTPRGAIGELAAWFTAALRAPNLAPKLAQLELYPVALCGRDFDTYLRQEKDEYSRIVREAKIRTD